MKVPLGLLCADDQGTGCAHGAGLGRTEQSAKQTADGQDKQYQRFDDARGGQQLLFEAADRQHSAAKHDLARHGHVLANRDLQ